MPIPEHERGRTYSAQMSKEDEAWIEERARSIAICTCDGRPFHYVDLPVHGNIGDLLILHGTLAFGPSATWARANQPSSSSS